VYWCSGVSEVVM